MDDLSQPLPEDVPGTADDVAAGASRRPRRKNRKPRADAQNQAEHQIAPPVAEAALAEPDASAKGKPEEVLPVAAHSTEAPEGVPAKRRRRGGRGRKRTPDITAQLAANTRGQVEPAVPAVARAPALPDPVPHATQHESAPFKAIPLTADAPALLLEADASILAPVPVMDESDASRPGRSRRRGGRGRRSTQPAPSATGATPVTAAPKPQTQTAKAEPKTGSKGRKLLVSVLPQEQVEVVLLESGNVREYYIEMTNQIKIRGNIYKGVISNIDTNLQAAFVNYGAVKNGFLQIDEVHPEYYLNPISASKGYKFPPIQKVLKTGQEVLVQVGKEPTGNKGAFLTTWISLAGRFLVLTPGQNQIGISRKVEDGEERNRLRDLIKGLDPGEDLGAIVRTVSAGVTKTTMQKDLNFLKRLWRDIRKKGMQEKSPALVYQEPDLAARAVRDYLTDDVTEVWVDDEVTAAAMREMVSLLFPRKSDLIKLHTDPRRTLLEKFDALPQIEQIHSREVSLPSGGRLVFDQTEALMAIDINSGKSGGNKNNFEGMAFRTNLEAAEIIPHQLRLRDIGGQVVIDFIEMRDPNQVREVEKKLRASMKADRARHDIGGISSFGLLQIVRQRTGSSAISISMEACPFCQGTGTRRNMEWQAVQALRDLHRKMHDSRDSGQTGLVYTVETELAWYLLNHKREHLTRLEKELGVNLEIRPGRTS